MFVLMFSHMALASSQSLPIPVAVVDSGVLIHHPSLQGKVLPGFDMVSGALNLRGERSTNPLPDVRNAKCPNTVSPGAYRVHGTEVSSLIAANGTFGVKGVARNVLIVPVRVMSACGMSRRDLIDSIAWAAGLSVDNVPPNSNPAKIINLSFTGGHFTCQKDLQEIIDKVTQLGVFVVAAAGNTFKQRLQEPANCNGVISVGSVDHQDRVASYSALDERITVYVKRGTSQVQSNSAYAGLKVATFLLDTQGREDATVSIRSAGTSFSAAIVTGLIANLLNIDSSLDLNKLLMRLEVLTLPVQPEVSCPQCKPRVLLPLS